MKIVDMKCPNCGAGIENNNVAEGSNYTCPYCGSAYTFDDEAQHVQYDNAREAGYEFEQGRLQAQREHAQQSRQNADAYTGQVTYVYKKKRKTWLWVLGWIFIFPVPLTILMVRNKTLMLWLRIVIIVAAWAAYVAIGIAGT